MIGASRTWSSPTETPGASTRPPGAPGTNSLHNTKTRTVTSSWWQVFSGHGNCEEYRDWRAVELDENGKEICPEPVSNYLPSCWRAGEIIRERCAAAGESAEECDRRAREARQNYVEAGAEGHVTVPAAKTEDWLDSGQCTDCYMPAFNHRPALSSQYALAITNFDDPERPKRFKFGFLASSDNHTARPGTGYKEINRREMTDTGLAQIGDHIPSKATPEPRSVPVGPKVPRMPEFERFGSFFGTGGLVAVHSTGRNRQSIWDALERKEVYGTSGDRILLWFDLVTGSEGEGQMQAFPMGSQILSRRTPSSASVRWDRFTRSLAARNTARRPFRPSDCTTSAEGSATTPLTNAGSSPGSRWSEDPTSIHAE